MNSVFFTLRRSGGFLTKFSSSGGFSNLGSFENHSEVKTFYKYPCFLFRTISGQNWFKLLSTTMPFQGKNSVDITNELKKQGYTPTRMFILADDFFSSLGFPRLPFTFWRDSLLEKTKVEGRTMECHPTA
jgi:hypothetical protein